MNNTNQYLYLFTIGPVQSFIAQARKTQDLRAGSQMLSDLVHEAIQRLPKGSEVIFPEKNIRSKPNRFIAKVRTAQDMQAEGERIKRETLQFFMEKAKKLLESTGFYEQCKAQLEDFFKIYWVAIPYDEKEGNYKAQHARLEQLLGATKAARPFAQLEEKGRKCSLNGEYNVKFYRKTKEETEKNKTVLGDTEKLFHSEVKEVKVVDYADEQNGILNKELDAGEGLCAISFLKRRWIGEKGFPSVAEIALMYELSRLSEGKKQLLKDYKSIFTVEGFSRHFVKAEKSASVDFKKDELNTTFDEQLLYQESITQANFPCEPQRSLAAKFTAELNLKSKYYAILVFDADSMGSQLKGKDEKYQSDLSKCLGDFAKEATAYVNGSDENKKGRTVYAGGDDFLGFINLDYLLEVMQWLRVEFHKSINERMVSEFKQESPELSFSAGVAIAHYKTPLSEVLGWARASEKKAKDAFKEEDRAIQKNAFCLAVLKHSGEIHQTVWQFDYKNRAEVGTLVTLRKLLKALVSEDLSTKFIKNIGEEFYLLLDEKGELGGLGQDLFKAELARLMKRAKAPGSDFKVKELAEEVFQLYQTDGRKNFREFLYLLEILDFLHRELNPVVVKENTADYENLPA